jgi:hypothetical protein
MYNMFPERTYCVRGLFKAKSGVYFRLTKVDAGNLKCKYLNRPWSTLAVKVLRRSRDSSVDIVARLHIGQLKNQGGIVGRVKSIFRS